MGIGNGAEAAGIGIPASGISVWHRSIPVPDLAIIGTIAGVSSVAGYPEVAGATSVLMFSPFVGSFMLHVLLLQLCPCSYCRSAFVEGTCFRPRP